MSESSASYLWVGMVSVALVVLLVAGLGIYGEGQKLIESKHQEALRIMDAAREHCDEQEFYNANVVICERVEVEKEE